MIDATTLAKAISKNPDGGTLAVDGSPLPDVGYFVALPVGGASVGWHPFPSLTTIDALDRVLESIDLADPSVPFVGWWREPSSPDGRPIVLVEPVIHVWTTADALTVGRALSQTHVFSIVDQTSIPVRD